tara:strand:- start:41 stop:787 length:747 start_codon:yes stop_codon:yes gene_type:complete
MYQIVLIRHGESIWNKENRFTGWFDIDLTDTGVNQANQAGSLLAEKGFQFDLAYSSVLLRANRTLSLVLEKMGSTHLPIIKDWRLNERHYGALTGLDKNETAKQFGDEQVKIWRRSFDTPPPLVELDSKYFPGNDPKYANIDSLQLPRGESLSLTIDRVLPFWNNVIKPSIFDDKKVIIAAHGNSLRALVKHLDCLSESEIMDVNIPTGVPLVYNLDSDMTAISSEYLGDDREIKNMMELVEKQGKSS